MQQSLNRQYVSSVLGWCKGDGPLEDVITLRLCIEPQTHLMHTLRLLGSNAWETLQQSEEASQIKQGRTGTGLLRSFRALVAAHGTLESQLMDSAVRLMGDACKWSAMPLVDRTHARRSVFGK